MPLYHYRAATAKGQVRDGEFLAANEADLVRHLNAQGLTTLAVEERPAKIQKPKSTRQALSLYTRQLANFIESDVPLPRALEVLAKHSANFPLAPALAEQVTSGVAFPDALAAHPKVFNKVYVGLVRSGMESAQLANVLGELADHLELEQGRRQKLILALSYPSIVALVSFLVIIAMLTYVMPQVVQAFSSGRQQLPWLTETLLGLSGFIARHGAVLGLVLIACIGGIFAIARHPKGRPLWERLILGTPILGPLAQELALSRYLSTLALLLGSGTALLPAMRTARQVLPYARIEGQLAQAEDAVSRGINLTEALAATNLFDPMQIELIRSGEHSSQLLGSLSKAAKWQRERVDQRLAWLTGLIEPALIVVMGGLVLILVLAVMLPIVSINRLVGI